MNNSGLTSVHDPYYKPNGSHYNIFSLYFCSSASFDGYKMRLMFPKFRNDFVLINDPNKLDRLYFTL